MAPEKIPASEGILAAAEAAGWADDEPTETEDRDESGEQEQELPEGEPDENGNLERSEGDGSTEDLSDDARLEALPDNWFGIDLKAFADKHGIEAAEEHFEALSAVNRDANKKFRDTAEQLKAEREARAERKKEVRLRVPEEEVTEELTDEELLESLGIEAEYEELSKPIAALARLVTEQREQLESMSRASQTERQEQAFWSTFEAQETVYGKLPAEFDRETIEQYAVDNGIFNPVALYRDLAFPLAHARTAQPEVEPVSPDRKRSLATPRRRGAAGGSTKPAKPKSIAEAFEQAQAQLGLSD